MSRIVTTCPVTGATVPTGHRTTELKLFSVSQTLSFRCAACHQVHSWSRENMQTEEARPQEDQLPV